MFLRFSTTMIPYLRLADSVIRPGRGSGGRQLLIGLRASQRYSTAEDNVTKDVATSSTATVATSSGSLDTKTTSIDKGKIGLITHHRLDKFEKILLVWGGKYKSLKEVPDRVSQQTLERARNKARIKINIMMAVATLFGCILMVMSGKRAQKEGNTVVKMNEEWHKRINEEAKSKEEAKLAEAAK